MIPICPECSKFKEPYKLTIKNDILVCDKCGYVHPDKFVEKDGMLISEGTITLSPDPESTMYIKIIDNKDPSKVKFAVPYSFPLSPFHKGKKVRKYSIIAQYKLRAYYE